MGEKRVRMHLLGFAKRCDNIAPTPVSEVLTSTVNGVLGSGCLSMGAEVKAL